MKFTSKDGTAKLIKYAADEMGMDLSGKDRAEVIAEMKKVDPSLFDDTKTNGDQDLGDANDLSDTDEQEAEGKELTAVTINIHDNSGEDEEVDNFVQVGVNGVMYKVKKGEDARVPVGVYDVLNNAIESRFKNVVDKETKMKSLQETKVKRWPFSVIQKHYD
ncbi:hypothetical protein [Shewanella sp. MM_2022_3]|uniref:hypothetical protein n=1 Tax=Shewanella sp. MM_2022_3 TaxID=2923280 RepID=UPI001F4C1415|nr:hypothetical protein [Shewanella sp. MM_2022_3]MCH7421303.1 hypothetical protein [Shewanella sp. MM_2022_3]